MKAAILLTVLCGCAADPAAGVRRVRLSALEARLASYPEGFHIQRCEAVRAAWAQCAAEGLPPDDCGVDSFEWPYRGELGCGWTESDQLAAESHRTTVPPATVEVRDARMADR